MKKLSLLLLVLFTTMTLNAQSKKIDVKKSSISWTGKKVTGEHSGSINFKEGTLLFKNKKVIGGSFIADMTSLSNNDQTGSGKAKLEGHLRSTDFFDIETYKTASLVFKTIAEKKPNVYSITADLTVKGKTDTVKLDLIVNGKTATSTFIVDRTKFGIQYGSGSFFDDLGDRTIYDEFDISVVLKY